MDIYIFLNYASWIIFLKIMLHGSTISTPPQRFNQSFSLYSCPEPHNNNNNQCFSSGANLSLRKWNLQEASAQLWGNGSWSGLGDDNLCYTTGLWKGSFVCIRGKQLIFFFPTPCLVKVSGWLHHYSRKRPVEIKCFSPIYSASGLNWNGVKTLTMKPWIKKKKKEDGTFCSVRKQNEHPRS